MKYPTVAGACAAAICSFVLAGPALAVRPPAGVSSGGRVWQADPAAGRRSQRRSWDVSPAQGRGAWRSFLAARGQTGWRALWNVETGVPSRVFGKGIAAPGSVGDAATAEAYARDVLASHVDLLAPGADVDGFELVADDLDQGFRSAFGLATPLVSLAADRGLRTVALAQRARVGATWVRVAGAFVSFRFKKDRLVAIASSALPGAGGSAPVVAAPAAEAAAMAWALETHGRAALSRPPELVVVPDGRRSTSTAWRVVVEAADPSARYDMWIGAAAGTRIAREQLLRFAQGSVLYDTPVRSPQKARATYPAPLASLLVDGAAGATDVAGSIVWPGPAAATLDLSPTGARIVLENAEGPLATASFPLDDQGQVTWSLANDEVGDAQLSAFVHAGLAMERIHTIAPELSFGEDPVAIRVNSDEQKYKCNAFWNGESANFHREFSACNNTARLPDVIYHELGHGFHQHSIIFGAGAWDGSLSEGAADYLAATMTGDPEIAPGFFIDGGYLRELDSDRVWPDDIDSDIHETGRIYGGAMWDLRTLLSAELGETEGVALADWLDFQALRRSDDIPSTYVEILVADDDDGDLSNGTPHVCAISDAFLRHGLSGAVNTAGVTGTHAALGLVPAGEPVRIEVETIELYPQCTGDPLELVEIQWRQRGTGLWNAVELAASGATFSGDIPAQPQGTALEYRVVLEAGKSELSLPDNIADPKYRTFAGEVRALYETDFDGGGTDWTPGSASGSTDFEAGTPKGDGGDPDAAFSGATVIGNELGTKGKYDDDKTVFMDGPIVDLEGEAFVRLQFRRWLTVEDGYFDQASVYVNGTRLWQNDGTDETDGTLDHIDRQWRFEDIDLSHLVTAGATTAQIRFELVSDGYREFGGWTIDDIALVAHDPPPSPVDNPTGGGAASLPPPIIDELVAGGGGCGCSTPATSTPGSLAALACALVLVRRRRSRGGRG